ncbi:glycine--tRNA ligase [Limosilactobacillus frumenti DSM 13145]|uniref:Glycine--tRNA ligase beta subunit n=1 Tax=Limosilactobacillus frumenti DSM 13145 TaxID=1423746 RepID=A0A0R1P4D5_9LACO|nr:glycine--tRNA ligase subunit beta [Limosilactobacillus frumenti]KRL27036.1 glycine--tRNA ligase [Limosilactobacillus frumenti DSM 13145]MBA2914213.1 glycine--tRNA ligase subunit beta [Limosilactobacillus frumenti]QFG72510.1 glycine--tRNA ligase subunit beta [Limosilactobacillus frumenti]
MANSYLLEVGVEEMPAHVVTPSIKQLHQRVADYLKKERISFNDIHEFATPRRLALLIDGLSDKQPDVDQSVKGPAKKIAQDSDGNWTKAAIGFTRGQGATVDDIQFKNVKGEEYVFVEKHIAGKNVAEVLQGLPDVITSMTFPTLMKWGYYNLQFIRPIRWLVSLLNDQVVPFKILDITAGRTTRGHRFLGHKFDLKQATDYEKALHDDFVIADQAKRKQVIEDQIDQIVKANDWVIDKDADLLEEVNNLVEWPTTFSGSFDPKYLVLPDEVLITSMKDNQRFFYLRDHDGKLLPHFIAVRNGNTDYLDNVIKGNERVLVPRLEDAKFFYEEDQKISIDEYVDRLKRVSFHDKISSMYDKMQRVAAIARVLGKHLHLSDQEMADLDRAAHIYKFDLTTQMVGEFAELQGIMGDIYAKLFGEDDAVATAIREHYMPISADGDLPASKVGAVLAVADKLDSIMSFFAVDMIPSGSNDPYALRRQAFGIVRIIADRDWHLPLLDIQPEIVQAFNDDQLNVSIDITKNADQVRAFFMDRIHQLLSENKTGHDVIDAVTKAQTADIEDVLESAETIKQHHSDDDFKENIEALTRVLRIAKKGQGAAQVDASLFQNPSEKELADAVNKLNDHADHNSPADNFAALNALSPIINRYFDENMIMDKDEKIKNNRLALLNQIAHQVYQIGDLDQLVIK